MYLRVFVRLQIFFGSENVFSCRPDPVSSARLNSAGEDERDFSALRSVRSEL